MLKVILMVKRRGDISHKQFREHYETVHVPLAGSSIPKVARYVRNYLSSAPGQAEPLFDCVTEMWFADDASRREAAIWMASSSSQPLRDDEEKFMDRAATVFYSADECGGTD